MADDRPEILRPTPRRPFNFSLISSSPTADDARSLPFSRKLSSRPQWLDPDATVPPANIARRFTPSDTAASLSRPQSFTNLTSPALAGIYAPALSLSMQRGKFHVDDVDEDLYARDDDDNTPWGTGAQTPIRRPGVDDAIYELMRGRSHNTQTGSLHKRGAASARASSADHTSTPAAAASLALRMAILFAFGVGYGLMVTSVHHQGPSPYLAQGSYSSHTGARHAPSRGRSSAGSILGDSSDLRALLFWGVAGVLLGALLPWLDNLSDDDKRAGPSGRQGGAATGLERPDEDSDGVSGTDWTLVMRAIGAFVGIVYAIRKLAWTSTTQASVTLALANPLLWWLVDRSQPGFLLSTAVGLAGSALMFGMSPDTVPAPLANGSWNASVDALSSVEGSVLGGLANQHTIGSGIWTWSVLFCSCVFFGNIGRRLAWK